MPEPLGSFLNNFYTINWDSDPKHHAKRVEELSERKRRALPSHTESSELTGVFVACGLSRTVVLEERSGDTWCEGMRRRR